MAGNFCAKRDRSDSDESKKVRTRPTPKGVVDQLELLPESVGSGTNLRRYWAAFCQIDLYPLTEIKGEATGHVSAIIDKIIQRCIHATHPFKLVTELLLNQWTLRAQRGSGGKKTYDAATAAAARTADQWSMLLAVQRVVGRPPASSPKAKDVTEQRSRAWTRWHKVRDSIHAEPTKDVLSTMSLDEARERALKDVPATIKERREQFLEHARAFQLVSATLTRALDRAAKRKRPKDAEGNRQVIVEKVTALIVAQKAVPSEWRLPGHGDTDHHDNGQYSRGLVADADDSSRCSLQ